MPNKRCERIARIDAGWARFGHAADPLYHRPFPNPFSFSLPSYHQHKANRTRRSRVCDIKEGFTSVGKMAYDMRLSSHANNIRHTIPKQLEIANIVQGLGRITLHHGGQATEYTVLAVGGKGFFAVSWPSLDSNGCIRAKLSFLAGLLAVYYQWRDTASSDETDQAINYALKFGIAYPVLDVVSPKHSLLALGTHPNTCAHSLCHCTWKVVTVRHIDTASRSRRPFGEIHRCQFSVSYPP